MYNMVNLYAIVEPKNQVESDLKIKINASFLDLLNDTLI